MNADSTGVSNDS